MKRNSAACRLLRLVLEKNNWEIISKNGFSSSDFTGDAEVVYLFLQNYYSQYNEFPPVSLVEEVTAVKLPEIGSVEYTIDEFRKSLLGLKIRNKVEKIIDCLKDNDPEGALAYFNIEDSRLSIGRSFRKSGPSRYEEYLSRKIEGITGVEIPWPTLQKVYYKWADSTFSCILGLSSSGKSWLSCVCAAHARDHGRKVLMVSLENSAASFERRIDSLTYKIPFEDICRGTIDYRQESAWKKSLYKDVEGPGDIIIVDNTAVKYVSDILNLVSSEQPDIVIIDGAYRLADRFQTDKWGEASQIINDLQSAANKTKLPFLATSQLNPSKSKKLGGYDLGFEARYAKEWFLSPDNVIAIVQTDDDRLFSQATIHICKIRESGDAPPKSEFKIRCDRVNMDFSEIIEDSELDIEF